ncbi:MAG: hypothetical protein K6G47_08510 [Clostridia bacterium]|nr:hypothetical protein [Clostridia bacterium]
MFKRITVLLLFLIILTAFGICSCNSKLQQEPAVSNEASQESEGTSAQTELEDITVVTEETDQPNEATTPIDDLLGLGPGRIEVTTNDGLGLERWLFVCDLDNHVVAECGRWIDISNEEAAYFFVDIDGDDTSELICNTQYGDGAERVKIFRNTDGIIEYGSVKESYICEEFGIDQLGYPGSFKEVYDPEMNLIEVTMYESDNSASEVSIEIAINTEDAFEFLKYEYLE